MFTAKTTIFTCGKHFWEALFFTINGKGYIDWYTQSWLGTPERIRKERALNKRYTHKLFSPPFVF